MTDFMRYYANLDEPHQQAAPWAQAIEVPPGASLLFLAGQVGSVINDQAPAGTLAAYGDTEAQTRSTFANVDAALQQAGYDKGDIVKMQVFLIADPEHNNTVDLDGFNKAYRDYFGITGEGTPHVPVRTRIQTVQLVDPALLVEIDVTAAKRKTTSD